MPAMGMQKWSVSAPMMYWQYRSTTKSDHGSANVRNYRNMSSQHLRGQWPTI